MAYAGFYLEGARRLTSKEEWKSKESFVVAGSIAVHFPPNKKDISSEIFEINGFYKYEICINSINQSINSTVLILGVYREN